MALLRGVNLGPSNKIAMPELRTLAEGLGYEAVATYINSGNLLFESRRGVKGLAEEITAAISDTFGHTIDVTVRTHDQLVGIVANNPYPEGNPSQVTVAFLTKAPPPGAEEKVAAAAAEYEPFTFAGHEVYVHYSHGIGTSKLAEQFSKIVGVSATVRNLRTVSKLVDLQNS